MTDGSNSSELLSLVYILRLKTKKVNSFMKIFSYWIQFWFIRKISQNERVWRNFAGIRTQLQVQVPVKFVEEWSDIWIVYLKEKQGMSKNIFKIKMQWNILWSHKLCDHKTSLDSQKEINEEFFVFWVYLHLFLSFFTGQKKCVTHWRGFYTHTLSLSLSLSHIHTQSLLVVIGSKLI